MNFNNFDLSKANVKSNISELKKIIDERLDTVDIFSRYLGFQVKLGKAIKSPLRDKDKHPSFNIYRSTTGKIVFNDFAGSKGDIFTFVMLLYGITFKDAVVKIAQDYNLNTIGYESMEYLKKRSVPININTEIKQRAMFGWEDKEFTKEELAYWMQYNISKEVLDEYEVRSVLWANMNGRIVYYNDNNPIFCYPYETGGLRFYMPLEKDKKAKHRGNVNETDIPFGLKQARGSNSKIMAVCAGQKDVLSLYANTGIRGISLTSENSFMKPEVFIEAMTHTNKLVVIYDNDEAGIKYANKLAEQYPIEVIKIGELTGLSKAIVKDVSDYYKYKKDFILSEDVIKDKLLNIS